MTEWLSRLYWQHGKWFVRICAAIGAIDLLLVLTPTTSVVTARYMGLTGRQTAMTMAVSDPLLALSIAVATVYAWPQLRMVSRWTAGDRDGLTAREVADAAHRLPIRLFVATAIGAFTVAFPAGIVTTLSQIHQLTFGNFIVVITAGTVYSLWGVVLLWTWGDLSMRPVLADVSVGDPAALAPRRTWWTVTVKLIFVAGSALLVGSCYGGAIAVRPDTELRGLWRLTWITMVVSVVFGIVLIPVLGSMLLEPVRALSRATRAVNADNLDVHVPVTSRDELGQLAASFNEMVVGLQERTALRTDNAKLVTELRASQQRIVASSDTARRHVERDLHDGAQQQLVTALLKARMLGRATPADLARLQEELVRDIELALSELRDLGQGVYPAELDDEGVVGALSAVAARTPTLCTVTSSGIGRLRPEVEAAIYFSCMEALQNAAKYAGTAARVDVTLSKVDGGVSFAVIDNGRGFTPEQVETGSGLQNIADRMGALGGRTEVTSAVGSGTTVIGWIPLAVSPDADQLGE